MYSGGYSNGGYFDGGAYSYPYGFPATNDGYMAFGADGGAAQTNAWQQQQHQQRNGSWGMFNTHGQGPMQQMQGYVEEYDPNNPSQAGNAYGVEQNGHDEEGDVSDLPLEELDEEQLLKLPLEQLQRLDRQHVPPTAAGHPAQTPYPTDNPQKQQGPDPTRAHLTTGGISISNEQKDDKVSLDKPSVDKMAALRAKLLATRGRSNTPDGRHPSPAINGPTQLAGSHAKPNIGSSLTESRTNRPNSTSMMVGDLDGLINEGKAAAAADAVAKRNSIPNEPTNNSDRKGTDAKIEKLGPKEQPTATVQPEHEKKIQKSTAPPKTVPAEVRKESTPKKGTLRASTSGLSDVSTESGEIQEQPGPKAQSKTPIQEKWSQTSAREGRAPLPTSAPANKRSEESGRAKPPYHGRPTGPAPHAEPQRGDMRNGGGRETYSNKGQFEKDGFRPQSASSKPKTKQTEFSSDKPRSDALPWTAEKDNKNFTGAIIPTTQISMEPREVSRPRPAVPVEESVPRPEYLGEIGEWLELTGYHNTEYRERKLKNYRRQQEIDRLQRELEEEEQQLETLHKPTLRASSARPGLASRAGSAVAMPPPPRPLLDMKPWDDTSLQVDADDGDDHKPPRGLKRAGSPADGPRSGRENTHKLARLDTSAGAEDRDAADNRFTDSATRVSAHDSAISRRSDDGPLGLRVKGAVEDDRARRSSLAPSLEARSRPASPLPLSDRISLPDGPRYPRAVDKYPSRYGTRDDRPRYDRPRSLSPGYHSNRSSYPERRDSGRDDYYKSEYYGGNAHSGYQDSYDRGNHRGRGSDRGGRGRGTYGRGGHKRGSTIESTGSSSLNLRAGGTRYFMIKSWNHENVEIAQQEGVWATQAHNEGVLAEAYNNCRNVILLFSVNKSMAFQGYALMTSPPGTADPPAWARNLIWPTSGAFNLRWIAIADTPFRKVGHIKNPLNEGLAVPVGRDGQEIEEGAGVAVCEIMDECGGGW